MGNNSVNVVLLEDNEDLRFLFKRLLSVELDVDALCVPSVNDLKSHADQVLQAKVVFLDVNLGEGVPTGIDAFAWLAENAYRGSVFFLTGHARHHPLVQAAAATGIQVLEKPVKSTELLAIVSDLGAETKS